MDGVEFQPLRTKVAVTTNNPASGQQALQIQTSGTSFFSRVIRPFNPTPIGVPPIDTSGSAALFSVDVKLDGPDTGEGITADLVSANVSAFSGGTRLGEIYISSNGYVYGYAAGTILYELAPVTLGQYHTLSLAIDFNTQQTSFLLDNQLLRTVTFAPSGSTFEKRLDSIVINGNSAVVYDNASQYTVSFDNVSVDITPVPEPSNLISFTVLGGLLLGSRMVKR